MTLVCHIISKLEQLDRQLAHCDSIIIISHLQLHKQTYLNVLTTVRFCTARNV